VLTLKSIGVTAVLAVSLALPATSAARLDNPERQFPAAPTQDLRNADRRAPEAPGPTQDLRNADRRAPAAPEPTQDLRNADRRAPGAGEVGVVPVEVPATTTIELPADGFDWGDAGIGAAFILALCSIAGGLLALTAVRRRRRVGMPAH
jgi:hypothetical protein